MNGDRFVWLLDPMNSVPTFVRSVTQMLRHSEGGVEVLQASTADSGLYIVALLCEYFVNSKFMKSSLMMSRKGCMALLANIGFQFWFLWGVTQQLQPNGTHLIQDGSMLVADFPGNVLLDKMFGTSFPYPSFPWAAATKGIPCKDP